VSLLKIKAINWGFAPFAQGMVGHIQSWTIKFVQWTIKIGQTRTHTLFGQSTSDSGQSSSDNRAHTFLINQLCTMSNQDRQPLDMLAQIAYDSIRVENAVIPKKKYEKVSNDVRELIIDNVTVRKISIYFWNYHLQIYYLERFNVYYRGS
jgi:hypothetical protein